MLKNNYFLSPQHYKNNLKLFQKFYTIYPKLEKDIFKLINYLRINSEKYLIEFNNYFQKSILVEILKEINKIEKKLHPFIIKKEISKAGKDYLDFLFENNIDKSYFNSNNRNKNCFNLKERLSKYGERSGKIFESVIINSGCAEDIVNKLIKDEKARKMILSQNMKYIGITCGFLPKWKSICTIIDIVQDFIAYKDMNTLNIDDESIKIINTLEFDENEFNFRNKKMLKNLENHDIHDNLCNDYSSKSILSNKISNNLISSKENNVKNDNIRDENNLNLLKGKKNINFSPIRNNYLNIFDNTISEHSKLISPLASYKSDAHLILKRNNSEIKKSLTSMKRINSNLNHDSNMYKQFSMTCKNTLGFANNRINNHILNYKFYKRNKDINMVNNDSENKIKVKKKIKLKNEKDLNNKYITERIREKEKIAMLNSLNEIKYKLKKEKEKNEGKSKKNEIDIEKYEIKNTNKKNVKKRDINSENIIKTEYDEIKDDKINNSISFDCNSYNLIEKEKYNINSNNNSTKSDIFFSQNDLLSNTSSKFFNKKHNLLFSHVIDINNFLSFKEEMMKQKLKANLKASNINKKNIEEKNESIKKNNFKIDNENISFKFDKAISNNSEVNIKQNEIENKMRNLNEYDYDNEDCYISKDKKEIKKLIRLYNKQRIEQKNKLNCYNTTNLSNENTNRKANRYSNTNNSNKKGTATFFYTKKEIRKEKEKEKEKEEEEKKIKVYKKQKLSGSNSYNKTIRKNNICINTPNNKINTLKNFFPRYIKTEISINENEIINKSHKNNLLTINNNFKEKKRIYSYIANRSKILNKKKGQEKLSTQNHYKNLEKNKFLSDKNLVETIKSPKNKIKSNYNENIETNVNSEINSNEYNNDNADKILKIDEYKFKNKEINTNIKYKKINNDTNKNYVYKKNKILENKNFNCYNKSLKKNIYLKTEINDKLFSKDNINLNSTKKKYLLSYKNTNISKK